MTDDERNPLDPGQRGVGDMDTDSLRRHGHQVVEWIAGYLERVDELDVRAPVSPGEVRSALPAAPPRRPEPFDDVLADLDDILLPGITHWNHPAFHAYFAITGSGPGILGEAIAAALNVNAMLWRTSPSATELEELTVDWLRQLLGLDDAWYGVLGDSASMSTLLALAAAREQTGLDIRQRGLAGRPDVPMLRIYTSEHAHSSVEKAAIALGLGRDGVRTIGVDDEYRIRPDLLAEAVREDGRFGYQPMAIVATVGTTSTTSIDPLDEVAEVRDALVEELGHDIWLHVDGAYGAMAAIAPELRWVLDGVGRADSLVTNPHKWLFTPIDCSALFVRDPSALTNAFSLVPEYLATDDDGVTDYMDWGVQLGRRFRALKLWMVIRYFGADGLAERIRTHVRWAGGVARWVEDHPDLHLIAPAPLSTVCFRAALDGVGGPTEPDPPNATGDGSDDAAERDAAEDELNRALIARVNATGRVYLSHTVLDGRTVVRLAVGNLRTTEERLAETLRVIDDQLRDLQTGATEREPPGPRSR